ncbi:MFS transporter [uncultured Pseudokineococcus sp.]|uniref:MFS transporter n=1 Tax=uncultured Pseudokineococcus sp. TaxID=1642928 RepID=UPI002612EBAC|nr:MFS transporter [uncultured Pseudokineococcus sp.]
MAAPGGTTEQEGSAVAPASSRDFRLVWAGTSAGRLGDSVASFAAPLVAVTVLDASAFVVTLLTAAAWLPWLLVGLPAGAWVDRLPRRPMMIGCDLVSVAVVASVPIAAATGALTIPHLLAAALAIGTTTVLFQTAWAGYLPAVLDSRQLVPANALLYGSESAARVAGPGLAGLLAGAVGAVAGYALQAVTFLVSATCLALVRTPERRPPPPPKRHLRREIAEGIRFVAGDRVLLNLASHGAVSNLFLTGYQALLVVFLIRQVGLTEATVGLLLTLTALGGIAGAMLAQPLMRWLGEARTLVLTKSLAGPFALAVPLTEQGWRLVLFVAASTLVVLGITAGNVISGSFRQRYVPGEILGRVTTSIQTLNYAGIPLGAVLAGALATAIGTRSALWALTVAYAATGLILLLGPLRGRRDLPTRGAAV